MGPVIEFFCTSKVCDSVLRVLAVAAAGCLAVGCSSPSVSSAGTGYRARGVASQPARRVKLSPKELVDRTKPAVVRIEVESSNGGSGFGTGFVVGTDGRIATNLHVIKDARSIRVTMADGQPLRFASIAAIDPERDLAIIRVAADNRLPSLVLGNSDEVAAGDPVVTIGNPLGVLDYSVSDGLISAVRPVTESLTLLQISAPISQGSSGGPLFNSYGEVIGVATLIIVQGQNLNFGIPSNYLRPLMDRNERLSLDNLVEKLQGYVAKTHPSQQPDKRPRIQRRVPQHDIAILDDCSKDTVRTAVDAISDAIQNGAPLYNQNNHEACYRIYEGTAMRLERELECSGLRDALGQGLLRASTEQGYTLKAWAMRDAFDGVLLVAGRKHPDLFNRSGNSAP